MTKSKETYQIGLSREELLTVMAYLKVEELAGFDLRWVQDLTEEQAKLISEVAERALFARSFIARDPAGKISVNPLVFAAVGACAAPERSVLLRQVVTGKPLSTLNFHISRKMNVIHFMPHPMMHQFLAVDEREKLVKALLSSLVLLSPSELPDQKPVELPMADLNEIRAAAKSGGIEGLEEKFLALDFTEAAAQAFTKALTDPVSFTILFMIDQNLEKADDFSLLQGKETVWMIEPSLDESDETKTVTITPTTAQVITEKVMQFMGE